MKAQANTKGVASLDDIIIHGWPPGETPPSSSVTATFEGHPSVAPATSPPVPPGSAAGHSGSASGGWGVLQAAGNSSTSNGIYLEKASLTSEPGSLQETEPPRLVSADTYSTDLIEDEVMDLPSRDLDQLAREFSQKMAAAKRSPRLSTDRKLLMHDVLHGSEGKAHHKRKKGAFAGVFVPTCENMWGVLIFLRFYWIVGHAGILQALAAVWLSFAAAFCTTSSMSAIASSGGIVSEGGPYHMISRALGPCVGASVGIMYWLAITMLSVLETLGAVEGLIMAEPRAEFAGCKQVYGSALMVMLSLFVWGGINLVTKLGILFALVVFYTLFSYYFGVCTAPLTDAAQANPWVTGLSFDTFQVNWSSHYTDGVSFGEVLSVFYPCFTGILSGANRADILRDPPKNIRQGTFGAIIFSLFMYSSFMVLWGMVADYHYLQGDTYHEDGHRRLAGGAAGAHVVEEIVWNPFSHSAHAGIIVSSLSQALQCLIVAPRLLQSISRDRILRVLNPIAPLSKKGEPVRALGATYIVAALLVLIGEINMVAPLLSMCFLVAYAFMNISCFMLTWLNSTAFRPRGIQHRRWRLWYMGTGSLGFLVCLAIMFTIDHWWALGALSLSISLYAYINWTLEAKEWGSALDGIRYNLALKSLTQMEETQKHVVNWRPQVLILYRIHVSEELRGITHHEILRLYSQMRKANGFCVVACVLEANPKDAHALHKAGIEKDIIKNIMKAENIKGFAEVVVAPSWAEGTSYIIQLTGIGGLQPNTVLLDWPQVPLQNRTKGHMRKCKEFASVLRIALASDKAVIAMKGLTDLPSQPVHGTIDIWWVIHDGGFLILLAWLLVQHRMWRTCHLRVFTITEGVDEAKAKGVAELLKKTLRQRRLFDVDVEVILADTEMLQPYSYDWTVRVEERQQFLQQQLGHSSKAALELDDLFKRDDNEIKEKLQHVGEEQLRREGSELGHIAITRLPERTRQASSSSTAPSPGEPTTARTSKRHPSVLSGLVAPGATAVASLGAGSAPFSRQTSLKDEAEAVQALNHIIYNRSKRAQLVIMNLPGLVDDDVEHVDNFMSYCDTMTKGLERVLFVHASGHEVFDLKD